MERIIKEIAKSVNSEIVQLFKDEKTDLIDLDKMKRKRKISATDYYKRIAERKDKTVSTAAAVVLFGCNIVAGYGCAEDDLIDLVCRESVKRCAIETVYNTEL